jgi:serine/threonine protein kinase/lipoprotein NlpI
MKRIDACPDADELEKMLSGNAGEAEITALESHLSECAACRQRVDSLAENAALEDDLHWAASVRAKTFVSIGEPLSKLNELFPDYEILREIGRGGMGIVYLANQPKLNRQVAIKVLPALLGVIHPESKARFRREAELAGSLDHTNIISIHDYGEAEGTLYYAMQLIRGRSLRAVLDEIRQGGAVGNAPNGDPGSPTSGSSASEIGSGPTPQMGREYYLQAAHWIAEVADALQYAHNRGITHRDIKPSNLLLTEDGKLMISDFGLARITGGQSMTASRSLVGTCRYMAPEQLRPGAPEADHLVDIYALGATLYELLAFRPMFSGLDDRSVIHQIESREPTPPHRFSKPVPRELETICLKAISKDPQARYQSAGEFADDLRRWSLGLPIAARRSPLPVRLLRVARRNRLAVAFSCLSVALALAAGAIWVKYDRASRAELEARSSESTERARAMVHQARLLIDDEAYEGALALLDESRALTEAIPEAAHQQAVALTRLGRLEEAKQILRAQNARDPSDWRSRYFLGMLLHSGHDPFGRSRSAARDPDANASSIKRSAAIGALLADVERLHPGSPEVDCLRSTIEPDHREAIRLLDQALAIDPDFTDALVERAVRSGCLGRFDAALADLDAAIAQRHGGHRVHGLRGIALYQLRRWSDAEAAFSRAIERNPLNVDWWYNRAVARTYTGRFAGAIDDAARAIALDAQYPEALVVRGRAYAGVGRVNDALADYNRAATLDPSMADIYVERGLIFWNMGDYERSLADANTLIQLDPRRTHGHQRRAQTYLKLGRWSDALADLDACDAIDPNDFATPTIRGGVYFFSGRYAQAAQAFAAGEALRPNDFGNYSFHALSMIRLGEHHAALETLTRWITLANNADMGRMRRGMVYESLGESSAALRDYADADSGNRLGVYPKLWSGILLALEGERARADALFEACAASAPEGSWERGLLDTVRGRTPPGALIQAAGNDAQRVEAHYYAGVAFLLGGDTDRAIAAFEAALSPLDSEVFESDFAGLRLGALRKGDASPGR